jgi:hypothetical protein
MLLTNFRLLKLFVYRGTREFSCRAKKHQSWQYLIFNISGIYRYKIELQGVNRR